MIKVSYSDSPWLLFESVKVSKQLLLSSKKNNSMNIYRIISLYLNLHRNLNVFVAPENLPLKAEEGVGGGQRNKLFSHALGKGGEGVTGMISATYQCDFY